MAEALAAGRIALHGWVYDIASGEIRAYQDDVAAVRGVIGIQTNYGWSDQSTGVPASPTRFTFQIG